MLDYVLVVRILEESRGMEVQCRHVAGAGGPGAPPHEASMDVGVVVHSIINFKYVVKSVVTEQGADFGFCPDLQSMTDQG